MNMFLHLPDSKRQVFCFILLINLREISIGKKHSENRLYLSAAMPFQQFGTLDVRKHFGANGS